MKKTIQFMIITLMAALLLISGCGSSPAGAGNSGSETASVQGEPGKIKIGVLKIADSFPLYVAEKEGLFQEQGLDVEIIDFQ